MEPNPDLHDTLTNASTTLSEDARGVAGSLQSHAKESWNSVQQGTSRAVREGSIYVRENPVPTLIAAVTFGLVVGFFLNRREPVSFKDRYVTEPMHESKGLLLGALVTLGALLQRVFSSASTAVAETAGDAGDELRSSLAPLHRAVQKTGRKLGL